MEAMRARTKRCSFVEVVVEELSIVDAEVLRARRYDAMRRGNIEGLLSVLRAPNDHATNHLGIPIYDVLSQREFDTR